MKNPKSEADNDMYNALIYDVALDILNAIPDDNESVKTLIRYGYNPNTILRQVSLYVACVIWQFINLKVNNMTECNEYESAPWKVCRSSVVGEIIIYSGNESNPLVVAKFSKDPSCYNVSNLMQHAKLMAAAPELLEALIMALPYVESELQHPGYKNGVKDKILKQIHYTINKAQGK